MWTVAAGFVPMALLALAAAGTAGGTECIECHASDLGLESPYATTFAWDRFAAGPHAGLACTDCHRGDYDDLPHAEEPAAACGECHDFETIEDEVAGGVHPFRCAHCHDPHAPAPPGDDLAVHDRVARGNAICLGCHDDPERWVAVAAPDRPRADLAEVHAWLPRTAKHKRIVLCVCCHTPADVQDVHRILPAAQAQRRCDACHGRSSLVAGMLYGEPERETWITHDVMFGDAYVKGAMRNRLVDGVLVLILVLALLGIAAHGVLRAAAARRVRAAGGPIEEERIYDSWVRSWHWLNALLFLALATTGFRIHFGGREEPLLSFETAFHLHNLAGLLAAVVYAWFLAAGWATGSARSYFGPPRGVVAGMVAQARYYLLGVFRRDPHPFHPTAERRFNPLQQTTYLVVMYAVFPVLTASGILLLVPEFLPETLLGRPAGWLVATVHYLCAAALAVFLVIHLYLITCGDRPGWGLKSMIDGVHRRYGGH